MIRPADLCLPLRRLPVGALAGAFAGVLAIASVACGGGSTASTVSPTGTAAATPDNSSTPGSTSTASAGPTPQATPSPLAPPQPQPLRELDLERVYRWFTADRPTHMQIAPDGTGRVFVSEQEGQLIVISGDPLADSGSEEVALDISERVSTDHTEEGFLGFAFHPRFAENGRLFLYYSAADPRRSVISEMQVNGNVVDPASERIIMEVSQPYGNHNGGMLIFGPDGYMYISLGDGGSSGDPHDNAQDLSTVLGSILRIDVDAPGQLYAVPPDNPFASGVAPDGGPAAPEIWAYGFRNPWRLAFDTVTGELWTADVGQNRFEEVDIIVPGGNYGWNFKEGMECYSPSNGCEEVAPDNIIEPLVTYGRSQGCSASGGYVYRGARLPSLYGAYIYGDFCSGIIWGLRHSNGVAAEHLIINQSGFQIPAFGPGLDGEVYVLTFGDGIYRFAGQ